MKPYLILFLLIGIKAEEWDANNYPNPTAGGFQKCSMRSRANICDPDGVLTEAARYRLDNDLKQLESRTRQENGATFCEKKGITAAMAVARHVRGGSTESVKQMAGEMLRKWTLDSQCQKAVVFVVSTDDMKFWVARDDMVPVFAGEFTELFMQQKKPLQQGDYQTALSNILHGTWEKAISKQGAPIDSRPDGPRPVSPGFGDDGRRPGSGGRSGGGGFKMPSIPGWVWLAIIFGLIPLLCCCLCCYFCCCRGKGGGAPASSFDDSNQGGGGRAQGGGRSGFSNLITSMGGAGIGSLIGNMLSGRNRGGGGGGGMFGNQGGGGQGGYGGYGGGSGGYNPTPAYDQGGRGGGGGGRGLYPTTPHKDEGGGGSWG